MIVVDSTEDYVLYPHVVISSPFGARKSPCCHAGQAQSHKLGCEARRSLYVVNKCPFGSVLPYAKDSPLGPLLHQADPRYSHTLPR
jgi:hypothetical protein